MAAQSIRLLILGCGTSQGVPAIGCRCATCASADPRDKRLRPSAIFTIGRVHILVDTSPDFRQQMLRTQIPTLDAVLFTHHHYDHIGGFDDLRQFNVIQMRPIRCYGMKQTLDEIALTFRYAFGDLLQVGGGVPQAEMIPIEAGMNVIGGIPIETIEAMHGLLPVFAYRIGSLAYVTDVSELTDRAIDALQGLDALVLDALRHEPHPTHLNLDQALALAERIGAKQTYFTHLAHNIHFERDTPLLPDSMQFAYDGLEILGVLDR